MKISDLSIGRRLGLGLGVILLITTGAIVYAITSLNDISRTSREFSNESLKQERAAQEWVSNLTLSGLRNLTAAKFGDSAGANSIYATIDLADPIGLSKRAAELQKIILTAVDTPEGKHLMEDLATKRGAYLKERDIFLKLLEEGKKDQVAKMADGSLRETQKPFVVATKKMLEYIRKRTGEKQEVMQAESAHIANLLTALSAVALLLAVAIAFLLTRSITRPLKEAVSVAEKVAAGDLRSKIESNAKDETGALLAAIATMQDKLKQLIGSVQRDVGAVSSSASQLAVSADELSSSAVAQNEAVSSTAASVEELTVSIAQMSGSAQMAQDVVEATVKVSDSGLEMGNKVSREIGEIDHSVSEFAQQMQALQGQAAE
ncbi:MAG TPA: HAMP domain-containing protein, partial [Burkholderiales bacterium]